MHISVRFCFRWFLSTLLVGVPIAYVFWTWRFAEHPVLPALSYQTVNASLGSNPQPVFWTYALWALTALLCINTLTLIVAWLLGKVYPDQPGARSRA